ncbi:MAG: hypothetical protein Q9202_004294 [Teloschistes flavicans]
MTRKVACFHQGKATRHPTGHSQGTRHEQNTWVSKLILRTPSQKLKPLVPVLQRFKDFIDKNALVRIYATNMFNEVPNKPPYNHDPIGRPQVRDYNHMFELINTILGEGPPVIGDPATNSLIGFPINAILNWAMGTPSGYFFFTMPAVNEHFKAILSEWETFLAGPASQTVLNPEDGWTAAATLVALAAKGNCGKDHYTFEQLYKCPDVSKPTLGFPSWDAFFLREFQDGLRPVANPDSDHPSNNQCITHACESTPYRLSNDVRLRDTFWAKNQPYSLADMLNDTDLGAAFVGGTVYQAYLSALSYHRWHAPVSGTIVSITHVAGTYYSENFHQGFAADYDPYHQDDDGPHPPDGEAPNDSQPYLAEVATRAVVVIEADSEKIGRMAAVFVGICEVSSCEFWVQEGQRVRKGEGIGGFHYGGSTYCLVFRKETRLLFDGYDGERFYEGDDNRKVCSRLAWAV